LVKRFGSPFSKSHGCSCVIWREAIFGAKWGQNLKSIKCESVVYIVLVSLAIATLSYACIVLFMNVYLYILCK
jgi:hypothetical protein